MSDTTKMRALTMDRKVTPMAPRYDKAYGMYKNKDFYIISGMSGGRYLDI
jgi:hypothetical protein